MGMRGRWVDPVVNNCMPLAGGIACHGQAVCAAL